MDVCHIEGIKFYSEVSRTMAVNNLIIVSNRLPLKISDSKTSDDWKVEATVGGLASALSPLKKKMGFSWIGWPGKEVTETEKPLLTKIIRDKHGYEPVFLTKKEITGFYNEFSNQTIWPLFHYLPGRFEFTKSSWEIYKSVNEKFARKTAETAAPGSIVWIQDYQLMLVPQMIRSLRSDLKIGFFLHIPFPSSELYRLLPQRKEILEGLLGADLISFHTYDYVRHFATACSRILGVETAYGEISWNKRIIRVEANPLGIDVDKFLEITKKAEDDNVLTELRNRYAGKKIVLGIDRIDYTKGLDLKMKSFQSFLDQYPEYRNEVVLIQIAVPSREEVRDYIRLKKNLDETVGRINGKYGSIGHSPIHYITQGFSQEDLINLFKIADVLMVTPIRDGMNLVAFEYVVSKMGKSGTLILSEFAGVAGHLTGSIVVNPWDIDEVALAIKEAIEAPRAEVAKRALRNFINASEITSETWVSKFISAISVNRSEQKKLKSKLVYEYLEMNRNFKNAGKKIFILDYDGTLAEIKKRPMEAAPTPELKELLRKLSSLTNSKVVVVSGRSRPDLQSWLGDIEGLDLAAEHGLFHWKADKKEWIESTFIDLKWMETAEGVLQDFTRRLDGTEIEKKSASIAWHYRNAPESEGERLALELALHVEEVFANAPVEVLRGKKVIEVRYAGFNKGSFVQGYLKPYNLTDTDFVFCAGDDRTDEDMFQALHEFQWTCCVGDHGSSANYYSNGPAELRNVLSMLVS